MRPARRSRAASRLPCGRPELPRKPGHAPPAAVKLPPSIAPEVPASTPLARLRAKQVDDATRLLSDAIRARQDAERGAAFAQSRRDDAVEGPVRVPATKNKALWPEASSRAEDLAQRRRVERPGRRGQGRPRKRRLAKS